MNRRLFIHGTLSVGAAAVVPAAVAAPKEPFRLDYAPHEGLFEHSAGSDVVDQIAFAAEMGFRAWEDNDMRRRAPAEQQRIAGALQKHDLRMGVFVAAEISWVKPGITSGDPDSRARFLADVRNSVEIAKRVNATWMTVVPDHGDPKLRPNFQMANVVETLRQASDICAPHGLVMVIEPLNFRDHPGMFLTEIPQAYAICKAVDSPACKILFDIYHQQVTEGSIIFNIDSAWDEIAYFQVGDVPGRHEPTTGEINFRNIFRHIHAKGYDGVVGMEHGKSRDDIDGERALIDAYRYCDGFETAS